MKILFLGNWALSEGLTVSTVFPHVKLLLESGNVSQLVLVTIEREPGKKRVHPFLDQPKLVFEPLVRKSAGMGFLSRFVEMFNFSAKLDELIKKHSIDAVIARGAPAGVLALAACRKNAVPLYVESFEPHAEYMHESGVWKKWDPRYLIEKRGEKKVIAYAAGIMVVSENYRTRLIREKVPAEKVFVIPCITDTERFSFSNEQRIAIRERLGIGPDDLTGIYVGKFGGTYYKEDAFIFFSRLLQQEQRMHTIILTPDPPGQVKELLDTYGLPQHQFHILCVPNEEVAGYISAADFGYALIKPSPSKAYVSLVKCGEYWAIGIPVIITDNIGTDSDTIRNEGIGVVLEDSWKQQPESYFRNIISAVSSLDLRPKIRAIALRERSIEISRSVYRQLGFLK